MPQFIDEVDQLDREAAPDEETCRRLFRLLAGELNGVITGQKQMVRRVCQSLLLRGHALIEGLPGLGKTKVVSAMAMAIGLDYKRIQYMPDMLPSDLVGKHMFVKRNGGQELEWFYGPLFNPIVVADEINRAPPKVQAATLECMQERRCTLLERPLPLTVYHRAYREFLKAAWGRPLTCFGLPYPHPDDWTRVFYVVFATQNPIELEGTYPLSEAQTDRFMFKIVVEQPHIDTYRQIVNLNLSQPSPPYLEVFADDATFDAVAAARNQGSHKDLPRWLKTSLFFEASLAHVVSGPESMHNRMLADRPGLFDRVRLIVALTHFKVADSDLGRIDDDGTLPASLRDEQQELLRGYLAGWNNWPPPRPEVVTRSRDAVNKALTSRLFQYVESGSSPRGLIDWPRAAAAEAFLRGQSEVRREHFRAVADDVLRHRIRLSPQARAENIKPEHLIGLLLNALMPQVDAAVENDEDKAALLPEPAAKAG